MKPRIWYELSNSKSAVNGNIIYRDATQDEIAEMERQKAEMPEPEPPPEERLSIMEDAFAELCMEVFGNG